MCRRGALCRFARSKFLTTLEGNAVECTKDIAVNSYAAVDALIGGLSLPYIPDECMYSSRPSHIQCCSSSRYRLSTVAAILGAYSKFHNFVAIVDTTLKVSDVMSVADTLRASSSTGVTMVAIRHGSTFVATIGASRHVCTLDADRFIRLACSLTSREYSVTWCATREPAVYGSVVGRSNSSVWIDDTWCTNASPPMCGMHTSVAVPQFYSKLAAKNVALINTGPASIPGTAVGNCFELRFNTILRDVLTSCSKDGKCYFCAYVIALHNALCCDDTGATVASITSVSSFLASILRSV